MIFRITDYVHYGTLDNRERGTVRLTLRAHWGCPIR